MIYVQASVQWNSGIGSVDGGGPCTLTRRTGHTGARYSAVLPNSSTEVMDAIV